MNSLETSSKQQNFCRLHHAGTTKLINAILSRFLMSALFTMFVNWLIESSWRCKGQRPISKIRALLSPNGAVLLFHREVAFTGVGARPSFIRRFCWSSAINSTLKRFGTDELYLYAQYKAQLGGCCSFFGLSIWRGHHYRGKAAEAAAAGVRHVSFLRSLSPGRRDADEAAGECGPHVVACKSIIAHVQTMPALTMSVEKV